RAGARWAEARRPAPSRPEDRGARCVTCGGTGWLDFDETIGQRRLCPDCPPPRDPAGEGEACPLIFGGEDGAGNVVCSFCGAARPSAPTGETPCATCGKPEDALCE